MTDRLQVQESKRDRCEACQAVTDAGKPTTCPECPERMRVGRVGESRHATAPEWAMRVECQRCGEIMAAKYADGHLCDPDARRPKLHGSCEEHGCQWPEGIAVLIVEHKRYRDALESIVANANIYNEDDVQIAKEALDA